MTITKTPTEATKGKAFHASLHVDADAGCTPVVVECCTCDTTKVQCSCEDADYVCPDCERYYDTDIGNHDTWAEWNGER